MARKAKQQPVPIRSAPFGVQVPTIHLLERFSASDLETWQRRSRELDELHHELYHGLEPERVRRRQELIDALDTRPATSFDFEGWVRIVPYRYSNAPLSAAGSVRSIGGRFNIGMECDESGAAHIFPGLYIGDSHETAFRECYQIGTQELEATGLSAAELSLRKSDTSIRLRGHIERVFDIRVIDNLKPIAKVLAKFSVPRPLTALAKALRLGKPENLLIRTPEKLQATLQDTNWRLSPTQFGLPSTSQRFGHFLKLAGYEGVLYRSSKSPGSTCLAVFPSNIGSDRTFVELLDPAPPAVQPMRLDIDTADALCGWEYVRPQAGGELA